MENVVIEVVPFYNAMRLTGSRAVAVDTITWFLKLE